MEKCWIKLLERVRYRERRLVKKFGLNAKNLTVKRQIGKKKLGGCLKIWHEKKSKTGKIWVGVKNFGGKNPQNGKNLVVCVILV